MIGDPRLLAEVLMNVLTNAAEACARRPGGGGRITVELEAIDALPEVPGVDTVRVRITDDGPGIPSAVRDRVFELGFSTKPFGSGLGLAHAERVIRAHGGRIEIASREGEGTAVTLTIAASPVGPPTCAA
ncbi:MAG: hypothetical protein KatS3mg102_0640 [Planctomycetota bacterium]|nr:MAG: hypothetical protein KatS3mg102_0640 [Planctomycetota bacterium]